MNAYDELVERCAKAIFHDHCPSDLWQKNLSEYEREAYLGQARGVLAEVARTLEDVTPEMVDHGRAEMRRLSTGVSKVWTAMLRASPLIPPDEESRE